MLDSGFTFYAGTREVSIKRRIFILFAFCFLLFVFELLAQDTWIKTYQPFGDVDYYPEDIVVCQDGGYAVNGYYFYTDGMFFEEWGFLIKTDSNGNLLWADKDTLNFMEENRSYTFVETSEGDFISIGYSYSSSYMIKRDSAGNRLWTTSYNDFGANSMDNTNDDNIILGGAINSEIALRKIDGDGNTLWTNSYDCGNVAIANSIIQTMDNGYALTGYVSGNSYDIIVMKTDANGDSLWTSTYDGYDNFDYGKSITEDSSGNIMVAGEIQDPNITGFLWYLDEEGNTIWTQEVNSSIGHSHYSILHLPDNTFTAYSYSGSGGNREMTIYNFDNNYNISWISEIITNVARGDKCISYLPSDQFILALRDLGGSLYNNIGIAKTDSQGQVTAIDNFELSRPTDVIHNYPNPFNPETTIIFKFQKIIENPTIEIFNIKGEKVYSFPVNTITLNQNISITWDGTDNNRNPVSSGIYLYRLIADNHISETRKMTLLK